MNKARYSCRMQHTPHTIQVMFCTQYDQYRKKQEFAIIAAGIVLVALAVLLPVPGALRILLLAAGGWVIVSRNFPAVMRASDTVEARKKSGMQLPAYRFQFFPGNEFRQIGRIKPVIEKAAPYSRPPPAVSGFKQALQFVSQCVDLH